MEPLRNLTNEALTNLEELHKKPQSNTPTVSKSPVALDCLSDEGIAVSRLVERGESVTMNDATEIRLAIEEWYKPMTDEGFRIFVGEINRKGWDRNQLQAAWDRFKERRYPTWVLADFFGQPEPRVYPHTWYVAQIDQHAGNPHNAKLIGTYNVQGKCLWGWKAEIGDSLPAWVPPARIPVPALPAASDVRRPADPDTAQPVSEMLAMLKRATVAEARVEELEQECKRLHGIIGRMQAEGYAYPIEATPQYANGAEHFRSTEQG